MPRKINKFTLNDFHPEQTGGIKNFSLAHPKAILKNHLDGEPYLFNGFLLGLCTKGNATIEINFKHFKINPNSTLLIFPRQAFRIIKKSEDFQLHHVLFTLDFFTGLIPPSNFDLVLKVTLTPLHTLSHEAMLRLLRYYQAIVRQYNDEEKFYRPQIIRGLLYSLFLEIASLYRTGKTIDALGYTRQEKITKRFFELLIDHYRAERELAFYANELCITPKYLSDIVKSVTGSSVRKWMDDLLLTDAKILLKTTNASVLQIADELHFPNASFFGQYFKKHTGITPHKYRKL